MALDKTYHVRKNAEIETIMKRKDTVGDQFFVVYKLENPAASHFRFAISVSKKYGNAVERNRMRRRIREIIGKEPVKAGIDFFIVVKPASYPLLFAEITQDLHKLFARAKIIEV